MELVRTNLKVSIETARTSSAFELSDLTDLFTKTAAFHILPDRSVFGDNERLSLPYALNTNHRTAVIAALLNGSFPNADKTSAASNRIAGYMFLEDLFGPDLTVLCTFTRFACEQHGPDKTLLHLSAVLLDNRKNARTTTLIHEIRKRLFVINN
jgi:hypothetical protein